MFFLSVILYGFLKIKKGAKAPANKKSISYAIWMSPSFVYRQDGTNELSYMIF